MPPNNTFGILTPELVLGLSIKSWTSNPWAWRPIMVTEYFQRYYFDKISRNVSVSKNQKIQKAEG